MNKATCGQGKPSEDDILGIVASCMGDSGMRKRLLLMSRNGHVIREEAGKDDERDEEIHDIVDGYATKVRSHLVLLTIAVVDLLNII